VVYTKINIHVSVGESDGYLPPLRWIIVKYELAGIKIIQGRVTTAPDFNWIIEKIYDWFLIWDLTRPEKRNRFTNLQVFKEWLTKQY